MGKPVKLKDIVDAIGFQSDEHSYYVDIAKGEIVLMPEEVMRAVEVEADIEDLPDWEKDLVDVAQAIFADVNSRRFAPLPTSFDIHEYRIIERFCGSIEDEEIAKVLYTAIRGRGAFRVFKDTISRFGIAEKWYKFRDDALREIAIDWCESNNVEYSDK
ncbi:MAG: UPF0158 family protein [Candidatus Eisenbacteria bacterium]